jgi:LPXTG-site transpeptidase (sortase) family protein
MKRTLLRIGAIPLIILGVGVVSYVAGAHWLGDRATQRDQTHLSAQFQRNLEAATNPTRAFEEDPTIGSTAPAVTVTTTPGEDIAGPDQQPSVPPIIAETPPPHGEALGRILIPAVSIDWVIVEGVGQDDLAQGPGHMPGTAMPGQPGNAVISGHRTTHGAPFGDLDLLEPGDRITVETLIGTHTYEVVALVVVAPTDVWVTDQVDGAWITLTTCHPKGSSRERLIVFGRLVDGPNAAAIAARLTGDESPPQPA